jgi:TolA-binding protein
MVDLHPDAIASPELLLQRGLALGALGRHLEAIAILDRVSDQLPLDRPDRHLQLAEAQVRLGELVAARRTLGRLLQEFPDDESASRLLSTLDLRFEHLAMPTVPSEEVLVR